MKFYRIFFGVTLATPVFRSLYKPELYSAYYDYIFFFLLSILFVLYENKLIAKRQKEIIKKSKLVFKQKAFKVEIVNLMVVMFVVVLLLFSDHIKVYLTYLIIYLVVYLVNLTYKYLKESPFLIGLSEDRVLSNLRFPGEIPFNQIQVLKEENGKVILGHTEGEFSFDPSNFENGEQILATIKESKGV